MALTTTAGARPPGPCSPPARCTALVPGGGVGDGVDGGGGGRHASCGAAVAAAAAAAVASAAAGGGSTGLASIDAALSPKDGRHCSAALAGSEGRCRPPMLSCNRICAAAAYTAAAGGGLAAGAAGGVGADGEATACRSGRRCGVLDDPGRLTMSAVLGRSPEKAGPCSPRSEGPAAQDDSRRGGRASREAGRAQARRRCGAGGGRRRWLRLGATQRGAPCCPQQSCGPPAS